MTEWFALRVKSRFEKVVALAARNKGFEEFLPVCQSTGSPKSMDVPLFPGYVFCRLESEYRFPLLTIPGVLHLVSFGKVPAPIDEEEIRVIQAAIRSRLPVQSWPFLNAGERIRLDSGPLTGIDGYLIQVQNQDTLVVNLPVLRRAIAIGIDRDWIGCPAIVDPVEASPIGL